MCHVTAVIVAGGKGERMGAGINKVFLKLCGKEMILHTIAAFDSNSLVSDIVVVINDVDKCARLTDRENYTKPVTIVHGGNTRQESVYNGIRAAKGDILAIHDGARALITDKEISDVINDCIACGSSALGVKCKDTLKKADKEGFIEGTVNREYTYLIQTPQVFKREQILNAHKEAMEQGIDATDDCTLLERLGERIKITQGSYENLKLTTPEDVIIAENILKRRMIA